MREGNYWGMLKGKKIIYYILVCLFALLAAGCSASTLDKIQEEAPSLDTEPMKVDTGSDNKEETSPVIIEIEPYSTEVKLLAVGDIMMHDWQITAGYNAKTKTYNYDHFFAAVKDVFSEGDWVIGNLETTISGADLKYTGYPMFNAPAEILDTLKDIGFNVLTHANNHTLDRHEKGVVRTRDALEERGIFTHGTARSPEESEEILILEKNDIRIALMAYTYGTNGIPIPEGKDYLVNLIDEEKIIQDISKAKEQGADVVAISLHFGLEYQLQPNKDQITLAHNLIAAGADIILGSHPHVVQPYDIVQVQDENGEMRTGVIIYSMGNFISAQVGEERNLGLIFGLTIRKHFPEGKIEITDLKNIPTWVQRYKSEGITQFRVVPLAKSLEEQDDILLSASDYKNMQRYLDRINQHVESIVTTTTTK